MSSAVRERLIAAAVQVTITEGWSKVTMAGLADRAGVSRQTVYNELGSKPKLAETLINDELGRFLLVVQRAFDERADDLPGAVEQAVRDVLIYASDNQLLHAVVSATHGADTELLPLLTTNAHSLLATAHGVVASRVAAFDTGLSQPQLDAVIDMIVRVVLSHVMQPSGTPAETGADVSWLVARVVQGAFAATH